jgi:hypothetical protein
LPEGIEIVCLCPSAHLNNCSDQVIDMAQVQRIYARLFTHLSRKSATIFGQETIPELSTPHIGREVALVARTAALVYI